MSYQWIRASEIGEFVYCRRAWWLRQYGAAESQNAVELAAGTRHHQQHGRLVAQSVWARRLAYVAIFCAVAVLAFTLLSR
jgi:CRISPR/Cas system-associated exonuclease Cas4 (RecB family)